MSGFSSASFDKLPPGPPSEQEQITGQEPYLPLQPQPSPLDQGRFSYWHLPGESIELYRHLGVEAFKRWVPVSGDRARARGSDLGGLSGADRVDRLERLITATKLWEEVHLGGIAVMGAEQAAVNYFLGPSWESNVAFGAIQVIANLYPIMVQRYNRLRAERTVGRIHLQRS